MPRGTVYEERDEPEKGVIGVEEPNDKEGRLFELFELKGDGADGEERDGD